MNEGHYAIVVGINRYPEFKDLNNARDDAIDFSNWLINPNGGALPQENVALITVPDHQIPDGTPRNQARPVRDQVEDAMHIFNRRCEDQVLDNPLVWKDTRLYFFASGHGIAPIPREAALLMADASPELYGKNFACSRYIEFQQKAQYFKELVFFADCCRERVTTAPLLAPTWTNVNNQNGEVLTMRGYATHFGKLAFEEEDPDEDPNNLRGYFTKALLEGLEGKAVNSTTRVINARSLEDYVTERVQELTDKRQKPHFLGDSGIVFRKDVPIDEITNAQTQKVRISFPAGFTKKVNLLDGFHKLVASTVAGQGPWEVPLGQGFYRVKLEDGSSPFATGGFFQVLGEDSHVQL